MSKNGKTVHVDNIEIGYVGLLQNRCTITRTLRKIMFARVLDEDHIGLNASNKGLRCMITQPTGSKEICADDFRKGVDLCEKINGRKIIYPVTEPTKENFNAVDGDIIIFDTIEVGTFLKYIGFPLQLDRKNLKMAQKILLEPKVPIMRQQTPVILGSSFEFASLKNFDIDQFNQLKAIIESFECLKNDGNSSRISSEEKAFFKMKKYGKQ